MRGGLAVAERRLSGPAGARALPSAAWPVLRPAPKAGVKWSLTLFGFLLYLLVITSYRLPLGDVAIMMSLGGVAFQRGGIRFPPYLGWFIAFAVWSVLVTTQTAYPDWAMPQLITLIKLCLIVFAAIGDLPDTVMSRGVILKLQRKPRNKSVARLRETRLHAELK